MTTDTSPENLWNESQRDAMAALNLSVWRPVEMAQASPAKLSSVNLSGQFCYKAEQWLFCSEHPLPVELPRWLSDLVRACTGLTTRPAEVSPKMVSEWPAERIIEVAQTPPAADEKKALWQRIFPSHD
ncbi:hypothetical protein [Pseudidiomarina insulisalsae]|uniref:Uncharacterized protein n=1 Tax=Pseudidiomarina insulisalsae TaxID=575789 RepID=A0A432Y8Q0_9GAMM|nr:hypothetical protein [Pseudidiomarina insulisalsae]RUO57313.1 hypothetical protein CWI71_11695 [Pseudidiomarina insulisalsae]